MEAQNSFPAIRLNNVAKELSGKRLLYPQENTFSTPVILLESYLTKGFRD
jgi:3-methyladenine DNA glycosylase Mpg